MRTNLDKRRSHREGATKSRMWPCITAAILLFTAMVMPNGLYAQGDESQDNKPRHKKYKLVDLGTFGGPSSGISTLPLARMLTNSGMVAGFADTTTVDPLSPNENPDAYNSNGFLWKDGVLNSLGPLPGGFSSFGAAMNESGVVIGQSENGNIDPLLGLPELDAVIWVHGNIVDLGSFGGNESNPGDINGRGEVVGGALNSTADPFANNFGTFWFYPATTQIRAFLWQGGKLKDLGTLGGPDSFAAFINESGQIAGISYTDYTPNPGNGGQPAQHPFFWENGKMTDVGTLGGALGIPRDLNNRGQVVGASNLAGDLSYHPFFWQAGKISDLGTLGGDNGEAYAINDFGEIVGRADVTASKNHHAVLWKNGTITDLGVAAGWPCSTAIDINARGQVIIDTGICGVGGGPGLLWENGGPSVDLNALIDPASNITVGDADYINDRGEIVAIGTLLNGDQHAILLVPDGDCDDLEARIAAIQTKLSTGRHSSTMQHRYHTSGPAAAPLN
jgi:probable HAF family extracellular repeat protein